MAKAIGKAISSGRHLFVEAGTGIGKSLAYLVPFIEWAVKENKKVIVSTYTKTLQEQLIKKDLPFLEKVLEPDFRFVLCVGSRNYLCLRRFNHDINYGLFEDKKTEKIGKIDKWQSRTITGLRSELDFEPGETVWSKICRESDLCLGKKCAYKKECFYNRAKLKERRAHILVTNHHLYFSNLISGGRVLPDFDSVVFDEAHMLEDVATAFLGIEISNFRIKYFLDSIFNPQSGKGFLPKIRRLDRRRTEGIIKERLEETRASAKTFFSEAVSCFGGNSRISRIRTKNAVYNHLKEPLLGLTSILEELLKDIREEENRVEIKSLIFRGKEISTGLETIINMNLDGYVYWVEILKRDRHPKCILNAAPIDISREFRNQVLDKVKPVIFTSATLSTNGNFEFQKRGLGAEEADELLLGSPFDYGKNVLLYTPGRMPDPRIEPELYQEEVVAEIRKILSIIKGGTFLLFTSFKMMDAVYEALKGTAQTAAIMRQGDAPRYHLLEKFREKEHSVLMGTNTFWQGIDMPGKTLECVIITKLPFAVPDDPIVEAKMEMIRSQNKNPFIHYSLPQAIIMLRQGFGRLIRRSSDAGMVAILDPRTKTRYYGKSFLDALPDCGTASELKQVKKFFSQEDRQ